MQICLFLFGNIKKLQKKVFIIIVSYNGEKWIYKNLQSLKQSIYPINIIVVDNNSSDRSVPIIKSFPKVQLILSEENLGFGRANNLGIETALKQGADYVFLLNQDAWVFPDTIVNLVLAAETNKDFGILSSLHFSGDGITLDKNFETYWKKKIEAISEHIDNVDFVNAAAWLIPKNVIESVGYFEPMFSHYGEDRNFVYRVLYHHFKVVIVNNTKICHDRIIVRNFNKDVIQSKFKILTEVLNVNDSLFLSYLKGFRSVLGLPKYFSKFYSYQNVMLLFLKLLWYYFGLKLSLLKIYKTRESYK